MYHVSTMLRHSEADNQQIGKKRHIGNNVVVIVFHESNMPFDPKVISSHFNHVFFVIKKIKSDPESKTMYRLWTTSKSGVGEHLPLLRKSRIFEKDEEFKRYLQCKMINAERASYSSKGFATAMMITRKGLLGQIYEIHDKKHVH
eukprot:TRINITY_DN7957_c0_g1_i1.p1 TRINITY_DN7957_c0_g1~~TRINITY_DN7957_c0_g1_i1.p1  ORF type:complete len:145 (-),score=19.01 TRINITY_DN7957_c0_g1_i1:26-460(-)